MVVVLFALLLSLAGCKGTSGSGSQNYEYRIGQTIYWVGPERPAGTQWVPAGTDVNGDPIWKRPVTPQDGGGG